MSASITLENIRSFRAPLEGYPMAWVFEADNGKALSPEFSDQIIPLQPEAAQFLWNFECSQKALSVRKAHFKHCETFLAMHKNRSQIKKWLYERGIPFEQEVFWCHQPQQAFVLTWKMVIKFSETLFFGHDERIWDKTLNWSLEFNHNDVFYFGKDRIYTNQTQHDEEQKNLRIVEEAIQNGLNRAPKTEYGKKPYMK